MNTKLTTVALAALVAAVLTAFPVLAAPMGASDPGDGCLRSDRDAYTFSKPVMIPDGARCGVLIGPLATRGSGTLEGLVVRIDIRHPETGDIDLRLCYDENNDGIPDATAPLEFYLARGNACTSPEPFAYPVELEGDYYFHDGGPGSYEPIFSAFNHLERGGRFYLAAADSMAQDAGSIMDWTVYLTRPGAGSVGMGEEVFPAAFARLP